MKLYEAKNIIKDVFESSFDKEKFTYFIKNLLKNLEEKPFGNGGAYTGNLIPRAFQSVIRKMERIGKFEDEEGNIIDVLVVELNREHSIEYARTTQRNFIRWYLNGSRGDQFKDAALVAFHTEKSPEWRFSLIKMQYSLEKGKDILTPAKRSSFLVGEQGKSHTAQQQLIGLLQKEYPPYLSDLEDAFNIEAVSDEFYEKYKEQLFNLKEELDKIVENDSIIKTEFENKKIDTLNFAKKLLGQIVFLYFLQKKGWLGLKEGQSYGEGNRNFMRDLFEQAKAKGKNFFNDYLEFLFYDALSKKRTTDFYEKFGCRIPFLNGGLFDPLNFYDWEKTDIIIPNELFSDKTDDNEEGTGILDIFDLYNFTVKEDEPLDTEVAIDPEMLGKVFERMLEVKERKSKGAFYTPREIVHYMAQQSLAYFLDFELKDKVSKADLETFIHFGEQIIDKDIAIETGRLKASNNKYQIPENIRNNADAIDQALENIKICDPAVGSGAFPVGVMNEIVKLRNLLTPFIKNTEKRTAYDFKANAIQNSIYGVDIDAGAVEIAKLRLWLSLVVDESNISRIDPLPNLEYKIVRGNSLINIPKNKVKDYKLEQDIKKPIQDYYAITDKYEKQKQKQIIDQKIYEILQSVSKWEGYKVDFDFKLYFHEVFNEKGGFDVVIGNPPYVRADSGEEYLKFRKELLKSKQYKTLWEKWDLYVAFIEKSFQILNPNGTLTFIIPSAYLTAKYAQKSRKYFVENARIDRIDFLMDLDIFEATVKNIIFQFSKADFQNFRPLRLKHKNKFGDIEYLETDFQTKLKENVFNEILKKEFHFKNTLQWGAIFYVSVGLVLQSDEKKAKGLFKKADLISDKQDKIHSKAYIEGKNIKAYKVEKIRYLEWNTERCPKLIRRPTFPELYVFPKIIQGRMTGAIYDDNGLVSNDSTFISTFWHNLRNVQNRSINNSVAKDFKVKGTFQIAKKRKELEKQSQLFNIKYCLAILNSKFAKWFFNQVRRSAIGLYPDDIKKLPIKQIPASKQKPFEILVDYILFLKSQPEDTQSFYFEQIIDGMVYELYFEEEIKKAGCEIIKHLQDLPELKSKSKSSILLEDKSKTTADARRITNNVFAELYNKNHTVRKNLFFMDSVEKIKIIKESLETKR